MATKLRITSRHLLMVCICLCSLAPSLCELVLDYETIIPQFIGSDHVGHRPDPQLAQDHLQAFLKHQMNNNATKQDIYKTVLLQTLQQHKHAHKQLINLSQQMNGFPSWNKNSLLKQWVDHTLSKHAANRVFVKLPKEESSGNYSNKGSKYVKDIKMKRSRRSSENDGLMYIPLGGTKKKQCPTAADAAGISITQMAFLSICLTVFNIIVNISNNINNNNNNNNINSNNNLANTNAQISSNVNNANQINVMLPPPSPGKRKKRSTFRQVWETIHLPAKVMWKKCKRKVRKLLKFDKELDDRGEKQDDIDICTDDIDSSLEKSLLDMENHFTNLKSNSYVKPNINESIIEKEETLDEQLRLKMTSFKIKEPKLNITVEQRDEFSTTTIDSSNIDRIIGKTKGLASASMLIGLHEWLKKVSQDNPMCGGLHLCNQLENTEKSHFWISAVISFLSHQHLQAEKSENLHNYLNSAVKLKACRMFFPQCR